MVQFRPNKPFMLAESNKNEIDPKKSTNQDLSKATKKAKATAERLIKENEQNGKTIKVHINEDGSVLLTITDKKQVNSSTRKDSFDFTEQLKNTKIIEIDKDGNIKTPTNNQPQIA